MTGAACPAVELRDLHMRFGQTHVLCGVNLRIHAGECVALIGPNGAGKSTLFDVVSGRCAPSSGQVLLHGQRVEGKPPHKIHRLGLSRSFQITQIFPTLSVFDNVRCAALWSFGYRYSVWHRLPRATGLNQRVIALLESLGLAARREVPAGQLSYAEQRALELGITLAGEPTVVLLDEPTAGMSAAETQHFMALIRRLTVGRTLLVVEHDMGVVFGLADRVAVLVQGELLAFDAPQPVRADASVQQAYLGTPHAMQPSDHTKGHA